MLQLLLKNNRKLYSLLKHVSVVFFRRRVLLRTRFHNLCAAANLRVMFTFFSAKQSCLKLIQY